MMFKNIENYLAELMSNPDKARNFAENHRFTLFKCYDPQKVPAIQKWLYDMGLDMMIVDPDENIITPDGSVKISPDGSFVLSTQAEDGKRVTKYVPVSEEIKSFSDTPEPFIDNQGNIIFGNNVSDEKKVEYFQGIYDKAKKEIKTLSKKVGKQKDPKALNELEKYIKDNIDFFEGVKKQLLSPAPASEVLLKRMKEEYREKLLGNLIFYISDLRQDISETLKTAVEFALDESQKDQLDKMISEIDKRASLDKDPFVHNAYYLLKEQFLKLFMNPEKYGGVSKLLNDLSQKVQTLNSNSVKFDVIRSVYDSVKHFKNDKEMLQILNTYNVDVNHFLEAYLALRTNPQVLIYDKNNDLEDLFNDAQNITLIKDLGVKFRAQRIQEKLNDFNKNEVNRLIKEKKAIDDKYLSGAIPVPGVDWSALTEENIFSETGE